jgi:hypothetical protein
LIRRAHLPPTARAATKPAAAALPFAALWVFTAAIAGTGGCSTVDNGDPPADVNACRPSQQYFYEQVCPNYLARDYGGKTCKDASCHGASASNLLKITVTTCTPDAPPAVPFVAGSDWLASYLSAAQVMSCTDVNGASLYTNPSGLKPGHGGGKLFEPGGEEFDLLQRWVMPGP